MIPGSYFVNSTKMHDNLHVELKRVYMITDNHGHVKYSATYVI